jgi:hypothetical protein
MEKRFQPVPGRDTPSRTILPGLFRGGLFAAVILAGCLGFYFLQGGSSRQLLSTLGFVGGDSPQEASPAPSETTVQVATEPAPSPIPADAVAPKTPQVNPTPQTAAQPAPAKPRTKDPLQDPLARAALARVGRDPDAESYWYAAINNPNLSANERQDLIEDLNEEGLSNPRNPSPDDLPVILNRIKMIEVVGPDAMDKVNADAFQEAYKDLVNLAAKVI